MDFEENKTTINANAGLPIYTYPRKYWFQFWKPKRIEVGRRYPKYLDKTYSYYEKAQDIKGNYLKIEDKVKIISYSNNGVDSVNTIQQISGIFQGDLMLGDPYFYCYPNNVIKL